MSKKLVMVRYKDNWADEMDITGLAVLPSDEWEDMKEKSRNYFQRRPLSGWLCGIGSNECIEYPDYDSWIGCFTEAHVSQDVVDLLESVGMTAGYKNEMLIHEGEFSFPGDYAFDDDPSDSDLV